jgi:uncharacterized protein (TIGR03435 family)
VEQTIRYAATERVIRKPNSSGMAFLAIAYFVIVLIPTAFGQSNSKEQSLVATKTYIPTLSFDVASIRESNHNENYSEFLDSPPHSSRFDELDLRISQVIGAAYAVNYRFQLSGGPDWITSTRFNIHAKSDSAIDRQLANLSDEHAKLEKQHMLQMLLADRFKLRVHREMREGPVYVFTTAKTKPRLGKTSITALEDDKTKAATSDAHKGIWSSGSSHGIELNAHETSIQELAGLLSYYLRATVLDQTGLTDSYNFILQFHGTLSDLQSDDPSLWAPVEKAVQEQLGLNLRLTKGPIDTIVIDTIEKPSEN